jgi:hypothetical protein
MIPEQNQALRIDADAVLIVRNFCASHDQAMK